MFDGVVGVCLAIVALWLVQHWPAAQPASRCRVPVAWIVGTDRGWPGVSCPAPRLYPGEGLPIVATSERAAIVEARRRYRLPAWCSAIAWPRSSWGRP